MNNTFDHETALRLINGNPVKREDIKGFVSDASRVYEENQELKAKVEELLVTKQKLNKEVLLWKELVLQNIHE